MKKKINAACFFLAAFVLAVQPLTAEEYAVKNSYQLESGELLEYRLKNDIPVYVNSSVQNQVDAVYIVVEGGTVLQSPEFSGLESSLFEMMTYGSKKYPYETIKSLVYDNQSSISHYTMYCGSVLYLNCINYYLDKMLPVLLDGFLNPSFRQTEYESMMHDHFLSVQEMENDPQSILFNAVFDSVYKNSPLHTSSSVRKESLPNITVENMKALHKKILDASRIKIVAVGKFDVQKFVRTLDKTLGKLKKSGVSGLRIESGAAEIPDEKVTLYHENANGAELLAKVFVSPPVTSDDYVAACITGDIFSTVMFNVIREKYGACYTPESWVSSSFAPVGFDFGYRVSDIEHFPAYLKEAEDIMRSGKVISSVDKTGTVFDTLENSIEGYKNAYILRKYSSQSTSSGIASRITSSILQFGDVTSADAIPSKALSVTSDDVLRVFQKYWLDGKSCWFEMRGL